MLLTACPLAAAALAAARRSSRRRRAWGSFAFRASERRTAGVCAAASCYALARFSARFGWYTPYPGCSASRPHLAAQGPGAAPAACAGCGIIPTTAGACFC